MAIRIAVATNDGKMVNEHFGKAGRFLIFILDNAGYDLLEERKTSLSCSDQGHSDDLLERKADLISDCKAVVISRIGPGATDLLIERGVVPFSFQGSVREALAVVAGSGRISRP